MKALKILYAGNDKMFDGLYLSLLTMINRTKQPLDITILTADLHTQGSGFVPFSTKHINILKKLIKKNNKYNKIHFVDCTAWYLKTFKAMFNKCMYTPYTFFRFYIDKIYKTGKVLYIDTDTLICNDIAKAFDVNLDGVEMCVCRDRTNGWYTNWGRYFNAGVILFNIDEIKKTNLMSKAIKYCIEKMPRYFDQDALNYTWTKIKMWPHKYRFNYQRFKIKKETVIVHFNYWGNKKCKPWEIEKFNILKNKYHWNMWDEDYKTYFEMKKSLKEKLL